MSKVLPDLNLPFQLLELRVRESLGVPVLAELDRCITDGAYLTVRYRVGQGRRSIQYVPRPESYLSTVPEYAANIEHTT